MNKKSAWLASILTSGIMIASVGVTLRCGPDALKTRTVVSRSAGAGASSGPAAPHSRPQARKSAKAPAALKPPRSSDVRGLARKEFASLREKYNLMFVPTYDGSNQETHPKLLYFPNGWHGYRYWMSFTPYPGTNAGYENPSIAVSNDLKTWVVPKGLTNPVSGVPDDVKYGGHYSDSQLVMNGDTMELWYRADLGNRKTGRPDYSVDYYYRRVSTDGVHWSKPEEMQASKDLILSLVVLHEKNGYRFWYRNRFSRLMYADSTNGKTWKHAAPCRIPLPTGYSPWHQDIVFCSGRYYLLQTGIYNPNYSFKLFLSESADGIHFTPGTMFYPSGSPVILKDTWLYRSTFVPDGTGTFRMVISYRLPGNKWFMTQCALSQAAWDSACRTNRQIILKAPSADAQGKNSAAQPKKTSRTEKSSPVTNPKM